jgi:RNA-directed DNA polymerase
VVSKETFNSVEDYLWKLTYKWACRTHPNKPRHWVSKRYFGQFNECDSLKWPHLGAW